MYKTEKYLDQCITSIINQTYTNLEIILVDDGSPDNCPAKCDEWARRDSRIHVIHKPNGGPDTARNAGLDAAKGEFVGTIDSDDFVAPEFYERLYKLLTEHDADISMCRIIGVNEDGSIIKSVSENEPEYAVLSNEDLMNGFLHGWGEFTNIWVSWDKLYRAEIFQNLRFAGGNHEDSGTLHRIFGNCQKLISTTERLCYYRHREDSTMGKLHRGFQITSFQSMVYAGKDSYEYFMSIGRPDIADMCLRRLGGALRYGLNNMNYLQNRGEFACLPDTFRKMMLSHSFGTKLRGVKLALCWL